MPGLRRAVRGDHHADRRRRDPRSSERGRARDEAVEEHGDTPPLASEHDAGEKRNLEAAELGEWVTAGIDLERSPDGLDLPRDAVVVEPRPATAHERHVDVEQRRRERARRGRVGDSHLAEPDDVHVKLVHERFTRCERPGLLLFRHGRADSDVRGARPDPDGADELVLERRDDARVDDDQTYACVAREHVDRGPS